ncbi:efflux RND transporter periplasmic adaptor subunit [Arenimonas fontis]|uniref:Efflux RND transporter periplasmic adaptor subunit n=1 Tax=Arenimonas fontis TaxID=2608255 RepID=A0A5B2Z413_9GAMM|nr:efflux RND transporter periplasmic adaptor subunit [Arenimonas fontis]KAA2283678.1 efflux RND transporter periplasmic adaptor subunit [Arenimonas fontis]
MPGLRSFSLFRLLIAAAAILLAFVLWSALGSRDDGTARYRTAAVDRGQLQLAISATGALRALSTVDVGSQVSGQVKSVEVDFNQRVQAGQVIARIDPATFEARLNQARADLASARAALEEAIANRRNAEADYVRKRELAERRLIAGSELDLALAARDQARARVGSAEAAVLQRQAAVANAELDLRHTELRSPVDGVVLNRAVEPGQTVAASFQTPVLFQIAEDLSQMLIELSVDESDVGQLRAGQPVRFTVDAFPGREFAGQVKQVRLSATNTQNVITYPVIVAVDNPDGSLLPGMTANAEIEVSRREGVLRVPIAALRYRPADAPEPPAGAMRVGGSELAAAIPAMVAPLNLDASQRAALDADLAAMRERMQQRRTAAAGQAAGPAVPGGGPGGGVMIVAGAGNGAPSPEAIQQAILRRVLEGFAGFRASLDEARRAAFDQALREHLSARRATLWRLQYGKPVPVPVRVGASDSRHAEVQGEGLSEGDLVIVGEELAG